ncbi:PREDICTED: PRUPE_2G154200 [Prunus dulcis]|uniref:PREDICTED: PRUPE_2G154200 n=1 Tax=Prunus dulcis TaxID=3755 RepID=A0A5E4FK09_PRUDU|nr:PREDICTED: PRUPE_2G154200 [Prunus dulcis]
MGLPEPTYEFPEEFKQVILEKMNGTRLQLLARKSLFRASAINPNFNHDNLDDDLNGHLDDNCNDDQDDDNLNDDYG